MGDAYRLCVRALLRDPENRVYLIHEQISSGTRWWLPGGGVEPGESLHDALRRELTEELNVTNMVISESPIGTFTSPSRNAEESVSIVFETRFTPPTSMAECEPDILEADWVPLQTLRTKDGRTPNWLTDFFDQYHNELADETLYNLDSPSLL